MLYSELPHVYQFLCDHYADPAYINTIHDSLHLRFSWRLSTIPVLPEFKDSLQAPYAFWNQCHEAKEIKNLPPIPFAALQAYAKAHPTTQIALYVAEATHAIQRIHNNFEIWLHSHINNSF